MRKRTTIPQRARRTAAAEGHTLKPAQPKRVLPPVSKATGGLLPGVDLTDLHQLQKADDIEAVLRLIHFS